MAKITRLPAQSIIDGYKGTLDFYVHMGQPCVRSWPRKTGPNRSPAVTAQWPIFSYASRIWAGMSPTVQAAYNSLASNSGISGRDLAIRGYITNITTTPL